MMLSPGSQIFACGLFVGIGTLVAAYLLAKWWRK